MDQSIQTDRQTVEDRRCDESSLLTLDWSLFSICLLHLVDHRYCGDQNDGGKDLMQVKVGVKEAPGDANRGESLHHFKVARDRCASEM